MNNLAYPMLQAIMAAVLFGASAPLSKILLGGIEPVPMAAFLYLGSGLGLLAFRLLRGKQAAAGEAGIEKRDLPWLMGAVLAGGVAAPIVLMFGLRHTPASTASLLLNFEGVATTLMAVVFFKEAMGPRVWGAMGAITAASILLSWDASGQWGFSLGAAGVLAACILWGLDNNLSRNISAKDPVEITMIKGLGAGTFSLLLALGLHSPFPGMMPMVKAMLLGTVSYGASIVLFIRAMRSLGAARTSALFSMAPFVGAVLSLFLFREMPGPAFWAETLLMVGGAVLLLGEQHGHRHVHPFMTHNHRHRHDDGHHTHQHAEGEVPASGWHAHPHTHEPVEHTHPHTPDIHHRHRH